MAPLLKLAVLLVLFASGSAFRLQPHSSQASGLVFKDTLNVEAFADPKVEGVTLYLSDFTRPITERLQKDFFSDPSSASVTCARTGPMRLADNIERGPKGEDVFSELQIPKLFWVDGVAHEEFASRPVHSNRVDGAAHQLAKSLLFKSIKVKRVYDADTNTVVYVSYSDKLIKSDDDNKSRFKSSLCALHVE